MYSCTSYVYLRDTLPLLYPNSSYCKSGERQRREHSCSWSNTRYVGVLMDEESCVGISLVAYEESSWIDVLLRNARIFSRNSTKLVLHLNLASRYPNETLARWESQRTSINPQRIHVKRSPGTKDVDRPRPERHLY